MTGGPDLHDPRVHDALDRYWRANLRIMILLLLFWAGVSFGCGILLAEYGGDVPRER